MLTTAYYLPYYFSLPTSLLFLTDAFYGLRPLYLFLFLTTSYYCVYSLLLLPPIAQDLFLLSTPYYFLPPLTTLRPLTTYCFSYECYCFLATSCYFLLLLTTSTLFPLATSCYFLLRLFLLLLLTTTSYYFLLILAPAYYFFTYCLLLNTLANSDHLLLTTYFLLPSTTSNYSLETLLHLLLLLLHVRRHGGGSEKLQFADTTHSIEPSFCFFKLHHRACVHEVVRVVSVVR